MRDTTLYRFRGARPPKAGIRASVLTPTTQDDGTVVLRLYDPIDSWGDDWGVSAKEFASALDLIEPTSPIRLHINSPGGEVFEALAVLNMLRRHRASVTAVVDGLAASAASFVACGVTETVVAPNSQIMIHDAWGICVGNAADMHEMAALLDKVSANIASIYAGRAAGTTIEAWRSAMLAESWYSPDEAVAAGLADRVEDAPAAPQAAFDLSRFRHAGRASAPDPLPMTNASRRPALRLAATKAREHYRSTSDRTTF